MTLLVVVGCFAFIGGVFALAAWPFRANGGRGPVNANCAELEMRRSTDDSWERDALDRHNRDEIEWLINPANPASPLYLS